MTTKPAVGQNCRTMKQRFFAVAVELPTQAQGTSLIRIASFMVIAGKPSTRSGSKV